MTSRHPASPDGVSFDAVAAVLENIVRGLHGRPLAVDVAERPYTDTETLHFPSLVAVFDNAAENFRLLKTMAIHQWAQIAFGTWRLDLGRVADEFDEPGRALKILHALETLRLDGCVTRALPGAGADMRRLRGGCTDLDGQWAAAAAEIGREEARVECSVRWLTTLYRLPMPMSTCYQGVLMPLRVEKVRTRRIASEKGEFRAMLSELRADVEQDWLNTVRRQKGDAGGFSAECDETGQPLLRWGEQTVSMPVELAGLMRSIQQDLGGVPDEYLVTDGPDSRLPDVATDGRPFDAMTREAGHAEGACLYDEWDHARQRYRKDHCALREREVRPQWDDFVDATLCKHGGLVKSLRRTFEALRDDDRGLRRQPHGEDIDIDAVVEAFADDRAGIARSERVYRARRRVERDIAVMFMVDMSGSTKGWINEAEREALVLLCEALDTLGDTYAIYGFSGMTRSRCEVYPVKRFDEPYSREVHARISGMRPRDYTRMGAAIRHLSRLLDETPARTKLMIALSDGKPDDYTDYRGRYGVEDTRKALYEAHALGIHSFCITIDAQARDYLPHMYGAANYTFVDDVEKLPARVSEIYRRLTT